MQSLNGGAAGNDDHNTPGDNTYEGAGSGAGEHNPTPTRETCTTILSPTGSPHVGNSGPPQGINPAASGGKFASSNGNSVAGGAVNNQLKVPNPKSPSPGSLSASSATTSTSWTVNGDVAGAARGDSAQKPTPV